MIFNHYLIFDLILTFTKRFWVALKLTFNTTNWEIAETKTWMQWNEWVKTDMPPLWSRVATKISLQESLKNLLLVGNLFQMSTKLGFDPVSSVPLLSKIIQGAIKKREKSNQLFWCKYRVKFLFLAHYLQGNISPFTFIIFTTLWCHLFWSKFSIQKILKNANNCHKRPILANLPHWMAYYGLIWQPRIHWSPHSCNLIQ